jgi:hypothetical protein
MKKFYKLDKPETCPKCFNQVKWYQEIEYAHHKYFCKKCGHIWEWEIDIKFTKEELEDYADMLGVKK